MDDVTLLSWIERGQNFAALLVAIGVAAEFVLGFIAVPARHRLDQAKDADVLRLRNESAALGKEAAALRKEAETEKLARVKLEKEIAPRNLDDATRQNIGKELSKFSAHFSGRKIKVSSYSGDAEGIVFSLEVMDIITKAGIEVDPIIGRVVQVGPVAMGVAITGPRGDEEFIRSLGTNINSHADTDVKAEWNSKYTELDVFVGVKPVAGLPKLIQAAKPSSQNAN